MVPTQKFTRSSRALEEIESLHNRVINPCTVTIFTDSRVTLDSLRNFNNHAKRLTEIPDKMNKNMKIKEKKYIKYLDKSRQYC
jgi:ribonuclease HI